MNQRRTRTFLFLFQEICDQGCNFNDILSFIEKWSLQAASLSAVKDVFDACFCCSITPPVDPVVITIE